NAEVFRRLPWGREVLEGMLANDLVGFHIRPHALNFLDTVAQTLEARVDYERFAVERGGRRTWVRHFPISVDAEEIGTMVDSSEMVEAENVLRHRLGFTDCKIGLGVDRLDYTKGIPERLEALERMFEKYPEWIGRFAAWRERMDALHETVLRRNIFDWTIAVLDSAVRVELRRTPEPVEPSPTEPAG